MVPKLFGTRDWFCGRQFFHELEGVLAGGFRMIQACHIYCALYFYYFYITICENLWNSNMVADVTGSGAQAVMWAMGNICKCRWSFALLPAAHFLLCGLIPNSMDQYWPMSWGLGILKQFSWVWAWLQLKLDSFYHCLETRWGKNQNSIRVWNLGTGEISGNSLSFRNIKYTYESILFVFQFYPQLSASWEISLYSDALCTYFGEWL